jgi:ERCC4-type nuclease
MLAAWLSSQGCTGAAAFVQTTSIPIASAAQLAELGIVPLDVVTSCDEQIGPALARAAAQSWMAMRGALLPVLPLPTSHSVLPGRGDLAAVDRAHAHPVAVPKAPGHRFSSRVCATDFVGPKLSNPPSSGGAVVLMDSRERKQRDLQSSISCTAVTMTLPVGDYVFVGGDGLMRPCVIERKTDSDLAASVVDARYRLQKASMRRCLAAAAWADARLVYLSEAELRSMDRSTVKRVQSALSSTSLRDGMSVVRSQSTHQTGLWLHAFATCSEVLLPPTLEPDVWAGRVKDQQSLRASRTLLTRMLRVVRGSTHDFSIRIAQRHPTLPELFDALETVRSEHGDVAADFALVKLSEKTGMLSENASLALRQIVCSRNYRIP